MSNNFTTQSSVEKISLQPSVKEILYRNNAEPNVNFDIMTCQGSHYQEATLGQLYILGHVGYEEGEDMSYLTNLIGSLAKREYYAKRAVQETDPKLAFEQTLKKLNEVLENFFNTKELTLNVALLAVAGEMLYVSRIGKPKVALARNNEYVDVINNVELFQKDLNDNFQFSNIISGKIKPNDKLFAYIPVKSITTREKSIKTLFVNHSQDEFTDKLAQLASTATNFSCCGLHISMEEVKEIPIQSSYHQSYSVALASADLDGSIEDGQYASLASAPVREKSAYHTTSPSDRKTTKQAEVADLDDAQYMAPANAIHTSIRPTELSVGTRDTFINLIAKGLYRIKRLGRSSRQSQGQSAISKYGFIGVGLFLVVIGGTFAIRFFREPAQVTKGYNTAVTQKTLAETKITQGSTRDARTALLSAISSIADLHTTKIDSLRTDINKLYSTLDKTDPKKPELYKDLSQQYPNTTFTKIAMGQKGPIVINTTGSLTELDTTGLAEVTQLKTPASFLFGDSSVIGVYNGSDTFESYAFKTDKATTGTLKGSTSAINGALYQGNLYVLTSNSIVKYEDVVHGSAKPTAWSKESVQGIAIAIDGTAYVLTNDGHLVSYFKGKKSNDFDLQITPGDSAQLITSQDGQLIYVMSQANKKVYAFTKADGVLQSSYAIDALGTLKDATLDADGTLLWLLSTDNKVWKL